MFDLRQSLFLTLRADCLETTFNGVETPYERDNNQSIQFQIAVKYITQQQEKFVWLQYFLMWIINSLNKTKRT